MPLFDYAVGCSVGDKHNSTLISNLQILKNNAAKFILNTLLYLSTSDALNALKWVSLEM